MKHQMLEHASKHVNIESWTEYDATINKRNLSSMIYIDLLQNFRNI